MSPFWKGYLLACAVHVWIADFRGQKACIASAQDNWTPWYLSSTTTLLILIVAFWPAKKKYLLP